MNGEFIRVISPIPSGVGNSSLCNFYCSLGLPTLHVGDVFFHIFWLLHSFHSNVMREPIARAETSWADGTTTDYLGLSPKTGFGGRNNDERLGGVTKSLGVHTPSIPTKQNILRQVLLNAVINYERTID